MQKSIMRDGMRFVVDLNCNGDRVDISIRAGGGDHYFYEKDAPAWNVADQVEKAIAKHIQWYEGLKVKAAARKRKQAEEALVLEGIFEELE